MAYPALFTPHNLGGVSLKNRLLMAPMTRSRTSQPGDIPNELMAEYYRQRASAGIIITEATYVSLEGKGYARTPGIITNEQVAGWRKTADAVHHEGGVIFLQLWHTGRMSSYLVNGLQPVAPSTIVPSEDNKVYIYDGRPDGLITFVPVDTPRAMEAMEITWLQQAFVQGAIKAMEAGFDGVEIHGANGYIFDQFLRSTLNKRTDQYGGSMENRTRLLVETAKGIADAIGQQKVGVRLSPYVVYKDTEDPEILETTLLVAEQLNKLNIAYVHLAEADWPDGTELSDGFRKDLRKAFKNTIIATGNKTAEKAVALIESRHADLVGFGRYFVSNPDLPERLQRGAGLNEIVDSRRLYGGGDHVGYTDYPAMEGG
ncbi:alkene reductase [Chitinophaga varians]|uniref:Alkene reductase n=1 Tax=Chitinophaga varians TaxID=2202339 RepID=A0A847S286_9BACT|nr:alkene reductase [Chitinophaga varians]NLR67545.1 alkene reductase [Chitinophaga varians]